MKQFKSQSKKQQSGGITKLQRAHEELGFKENSTDYHYYGLLRNSENKEIAIDATAKYRTQASDMILDTYKEMVAQGRVSGDYKLKEVRVYQ